MYVKSSSGEVKRVCVCLQREMDAFLPGWMSGFVSSGACSP